MADLLSLDCGWSRKRGNSRLSLRLGMARVKTHPGEVLREEYLIPLSLSARALGKTGINVMTRRM